MALGSPPLSDETPLSDGTRDFHYMMPNRPSFKKRRLSTIHNLTIDIHLLLVLDRQEGENTGWCSCCDGPAKEIHQHGLSVWPIGSGKGNFKILVKIVSIAYLAGGWTNPNEKDARQIGFIFPKDPGVKK